MGDPIFETISISRLSLIFTDATVAFSRGRYVTSQSDSRLLRRLDTLDAATTPEDMNLPRFDFHQLGGFNPPRYTVHINDPWCFTFEFENGDAYVVDFEQYY